MSMLGYTYAGLFAALTYYTAKIINTDYLLTEWGVPEQYQNLDFQLGKYGWFIVSLVFLGTFIQTKPKQSLPSIIAGPLSGILFGVAYIIAEVSFSQLMVIETEWYLWNALIALTASGFSAVALKKSN